MPLPSRIHVQPRFSPRRADPAAIGIQPPALRYCIEPTGRTQSRFDGRLLVTPDLDLKRYTCRAAIDWLWLEFGTVQETQSKALKEHLEKRLGTRQAVTGATIPHHARKIPNHTGTHFRLKLQDPEPRSLCCVLHEIDAYRGLVGPVRVIGIEVAVDWYPNDHSDVDRWLMVAALQRHHLPFIEGLDHHSADLRHVFPKPGAKPGDEKQKETAFVIRDRRLRGSGKNREFSDFQLTEPAVMKRVLRAHGHEAPYLDSTVYRGPEEGPVMFRVQNKITDRRNPEADTVETLAQKDCRARLEVTLVHEAAAGMGLSEIGDLFGFSFRDLRKPYFPLWLPTIPGGVKKDGSGPTLVEDRLGRILSRVFAESGVYGAFLYEEGLRLRRLEDRKTWKEAGAVLRPAPGRRRDEHRHLLAWEEMRPRIGAALDRLSQEWSRERLQKLVGPGITAQAA